MPRTSEIAFNVPLLNVLRAKHPRWGDHTGAEQRGALRSKAGAVVRWPAAGWLAGSAGDLFPSLPVKRQISYIPVLRALMRNRPSILSRQKQAVLL